MSKSLKRVKKTAKELRSRQFFVVSSIVGTFLAIALPVFLWWQLFPSAFREFALPLHYNVHFGVDRFGAPWQLFTVPIIGGVVWVVSGIGSVVFWTRDKVLSYFFMSGGVLSLSILFFAMIFIVLLNLSHGI